MTLYDLLLQACGLSQREAADFHGVRLDTAKSWAQGRRAAPDGAINELRRLYERIEGAADQFLDLLDEMPEGGPEEIEIGYPADDHEAQSLGFPCVGAWRAMAARIAASIDQPIKLVPRGSTPATAAAIEARESDPLP